MRTHRTARQRSARRTRAGAVLIVGLALAVATVVASALFLTHEALGADHCPASGPTALAAILVDATDQLSPSQMLDVRNRLVKYTQTLPTGTGVQLWRVTAGGLGVPEPVGPVVCRPEREPNRLYQNPKAMRQHYAAFEREVLTQVDGSLTAAAQPQSPILEAVQAVTLRMFGAPQFGAVRTKNLLIVSDLRQNTAALSLLRSVPAFADFRATPAYLHLRSDLAGVNVQILFLARDASGIAATVQFWQALVADFGGALTEVERIVG